MYVTFAGRFTVAESSRLAIADHYTIVIPSLACQNIMKNLSCNHIATYLSKGISFLLHPFLMPVWLLTGLFAIGIIPHFIPASVKHYLWTVIILYTFLIPAMAVMLLKFFGIIPDLSLASRRDRVLPMIVLVAGYALCYWMLGVFPFLFILRRMLLVAVCCIIFAFIVNLFWQISLHMTAVGAAVGLVLLLVVAGYDVLWLFCLIVIAAGALASARLFLGRHSLPQIVVGFAGGFSIASLLLLA